MVNLLYLCFHSWGTRTSILAHRIQMCYYSTMFFPIMQNSTTFSFSWWFPLGLEFAFKYIKHLAFGFLSINFSFILHVFISISYFLLDLWTAHSWMWVLDLFGCHQSLLHRWLCWVRLGSLVPQQVWMYPLTKRVKVHPWQGGSFASYKSFPQSFPYREHVMRTAHWMKQWRHHILPFSCSTKLNKTLDGHEFEKKISLQS